MILSMSNQALVFLMMVCVGLVIGFLYDVIRVFRRILRHGNLLIQIEDLIYWIGVTVLAFYVILNKNYGEVRFFSVAGVFLGMILYFFSLSYLFMKVSMTVVNFIKKVLTVLLTIILTPFKLLYKLIKPILVFCKIKLAKYSINTKKALHKSKNYAKIRSRKFVKNAKIIVRKV